PASRNRVRCKTGPLTSGVPVLRAVFLIALVFFAACSRGAPVAASQATTAATGAQQAAPAAAPAKPVPAQLPDVIARVNGETIAKAEFEQAIQTIEQRNGSPVPADQRDRIYRDVLDQMIGYKLLVQEAQTRKLAVPD